MSDRPTSETTHIPTDVYPVGVLSDIHRIARAVFVRDHRLNGKRVGIVKFVLRTERRYLVGKVRKREWRAVRNSFNGYLAEHDGCAHNCGRGWTKRAAQRQADRICRTHIAEALASLDVRSSPGGQS